MQDVSRDLSTERPGEHSMHADAGKSGQDLETVTSPPQQHLGEDNFDAHILENIRGPLIKSACNILLHRPHDYFLDDC